MALPRPLSVREGRRPSEPRGFCCYCQSLAIAITNAGCPMIMATMRNNPSPDRRAPDRRAISCLTLQGRHDVDIERDRWRTPSKRSIHSPPRDASRGEFGMRRAHPSKQPALPQCQVPEVRAIPPAAVQAAWVRSIGSSTGSRESRKVPKCMGTISRAPTSWTACTASSGSMCIVCMNQRGAYAPIDSIAASIPG
jgi:hypothetical protein